MRSGGASHVVDNTHPASLANTNVVDPTTETIDQTVEETVRDSENLFSASSAAPIILEQDSIDIPQRLIRDEMPFQNVCAQFATPQRVANVNYSIGVLQTPGAPTTFLTNILGTYIATTRCQRALAPYKWFRGTLKLRWLFRCSATMYGSAYAWWYYGSRCDPDVSNTPAAKYLIATSSHCDVIDLAEHQELIWEIPFRWPENYLDKDNLPVYITTGFDLLQVASLEDAASTRVDIEVWASMEDVEVSGYIDAQSMPMVRQNHYYQSPAIRPLGGLATVSAAGAVAGAAYNVGTVVAGEAYAALRRKLLGTTVKQATSLYKDMTNTGTKSAEAQQTPVISQPYGNTASITPVTELQTLTEMACSKVPPDWGGCTEYHPLEDIVQNATLVGHKTFTAVSDEWELELVPFGAKTYMGEFTNYFRFYRGRHRIILNFFGSPLISARFHIIYSPTGALLNSTDGGKMMETIEVKGSSTHVIELPWVSRTPVIEPEDSLGILSVTCVAAPQPLSSGGAARIFLLAHACMAPGTQFFSLRKPGLELAPQPPPPPEAIEGQSSLREIGRGTPTIAFGGSGKIAPIDFMDPTFTVEEIMARWADRRYGPLNSAELFGDTLRPSTFFTEVNRKHAYNKWGDNVDSIAPMFTLWRGSREFRMGGGTATTGNVGITVMQQNSFASSINGLDIANGGACQNLAEAPVQIRVPFLSVYPALAAFEDSSIALTEPRATNTNILKPSYANWIYFSRAGPDFQVFHLNRLYTRCLSDA